MLANERILADRQGARCEAHHADWAWADFFIPRTHFVAVHIPPFWPISATREIGAMSAEADIEEPCGGFIAGAKC
jgi:hypothetical protein